MTRSLATLALLSASDAWLTLRLVCLGFEEVNPLMRLALDRGQVAFLALKAFLTASGCLLLYATRAQRTAWALCGLLGVVVAASLFALASSP